MTELTERRGKDRRGAADEAIITAARELVPFLVEGWDDQDEPEDQARADAACNKLVDAVHAAAPLAQKAPRQESDLNAIATRIAWDLGYLTSGQVREDCRESHIKLQGIAERHLKRAEAAEAKLVQVEAETIERCARMCPTSLEDLAGLLSSGELKATRALLNQPTATQEEVRTQNLMGENPISDPAPAAAPCPMRAATFSHVDGRDLLAELKPKAWHFCDIKVRINGRWKQYQGDWLKRLMLARDSCDCNTGKELERKGPTKIKKDVAAIEWAISLLEIHDGVKANPNSQEWLNRLKDLVPVKSLSMKETEQLLGAEEPIPFPIEPTPLGMIAAATPCPMRAATFSHVDGRDLLAELKSQKLGISAT